MSQTSYLDDDDYGDAPEFLVCPITQEVMEDPVITSDGHTFERSAIEAWLGKNNTNPMTGGEITSKALTPNFALRDACAAYKAKTNTKYQVNLLRIGVLSNVFSRNL